MNTKILMTASAITLGLLGIVFTFLPAEIDGYFEAGTVPHLQFLMQIMGALYFGFGMLNWMTKSNRMGGIYNRPVAVANVAHFTIGALALLKGCIANPGLPKVLWLLGGVYFVFAVAFGMVLFRDPLSETKPR